jgi:hypothetical protein
MKAVEAFFKNQKQQEIVESALKNAIPHPEGLLRE